MILKTTDPRALAEFRSLVVALEEQSAKAAEFLVAAADFIPPDLAHDGDPYTRGIGILYGKVLGIIPLDSENAVPPKGWRFTTTHVLVPTRHSKNGRRLYQMLEDIPVVDEEEFQRKTGAPVTLEHEGEEYRCEYYAEFDGDNPRAVTALYQEWPTDDLKDAVLEEARKSCIEWKIQ